MNFVNILTLNTDKKKKLSKYICKQHNMWPSCIKLEKKNPRNIEEIKYILKISLNISL